MGIETLFTPARIAAYTEELPEAEKPPTGFHGNRADAASGLAEDVPQRKLTYGKAAMIDDPEVVDEREQEKVMEGRDWYPGDPGETLDDYIKVRNIPGLTMAQTEKRLIELGVNRKVSVFHHETGQTFTGYHRDVLISARGRYYWVGDTDRAGRPVGCPFETGPNNEISRHHFENVRGL